jgi:hypothetical protein
MTLLRAAATPALFRMTIMTIMIMTIITHVP